MRSVQPAIPSGPISLTGMSADRLQREQLDPARAADERGDELARGLREQRLGRAVLGDLAALLHDRDPVAEQHGLVDVVGDEDDGLAEVALEPLELLLERAAADGVDGAERLVHQQHGRVGGERAGDADALLLAARELARVAVRHVLLEPDELDQLERAGALALAVPAEQLRDGGDVVGDRAVREQARPAG